MTAKSGDRSIWMHVLAVIFWIALIAVVFGIRLWIADGEVRCVFSEDPALCATVGEVGR